jgi:demethylmenaquinone methyltransferase/2-methoxy-6-polyprenyl-1,4-benzoquinol methylase
VLPRVIRLSTGSAEGELLLRYYWDTVAHCVPAAAILESLRSSGFVDVKHRARGGLLSEYIGSKSP